MPDMFARRLSLLLALALVFGGRAAEPNRHLLIVLDGLRPDYVTPEVMPNLYALGQKGVVFTNHHSVYPTVTRVNSSSISTGAYPERHGILGNSVFFPRINASGFLDTGQQANLEKIQVDQDGVLLTASTLGEVLQAQGRKMLAVGAGTTGSAFLLNHKMSGGAVLHTDFGLPETMYQRVVAELGPPPAEGHPNDARNRRAVESFLKIGLPTVNPTVTAMWLSDPDTTAHALGMGHPTTVEALRRLDREIKNIQDGLSALGLLDKYNIWVTSDHGFATYTGAPDVRALLKPFAGTLADGSPRVVNGETAIYVRDGNSKVVGRSCVQCSGRPALERSSPAGARQDRSAAGPKGRSRSMRHVGATRDRATSCIRRTGRIKRTLMELLEPARPTASPGMAARARLKFTIR